MEIIEGIHRADEASGNIAHANVYLMINQKEIIVIDTGTPGNAKKIVEYIQKIGHQSKEVSTIVLTHYHMDHCGSVKDLKELTGAKVASSIDDEGYISGRTPYPKPKNILMRAAFSFIKTAPVNVDIILRNDDKIGSLTVINTPGHTPGSIMLYDEKKKVLFTGDTLRFENNKVTTAPRQYTWDEGKEKDSIKKVASLDFDILLPGHGEILKGNASVKVKEFVEKEMK